MLRGTTRVAIKRLQTSILARHQRKVKPSSELLQTLPDVYEILESSNASYRVPCVLQSGLFVPPHWQIRSYSTQKPAFSQSVVASTTTAGSVTSDGEVSQECATTQGDNHDENSERTKRIEEARLIVDMWRKSGKYVPDEISDAELDEFAQLDSKMGRKKFLRFLASKEVKKKMKQIDRERKAEERAQRAEDDDKGKFDKNTIFLYIRPSTMVNADMWNFARGMKFGPDFVVDMGYDHEMNNREVKAMVKQLQEIIGVMKPQWEPFHMHWTNLLPGGRIEREMQRVFGDHLSKLLIDITHQPFLELFPRDRLVYLSPESPNVLTHYDPDKVYIIGGMVDLSIRKGLSFAKVKRHNLDSARLPLDHFMKWGSGSKNLTLDQMVNIMSNIKETNNWQSALKHVPVRKIEGMYEQSSQNRYRNQSPGWRPRPQFAQTGDFSFSRASRPPRQDSREDDYDSHREQTWYSRTPAHYEERYNSSHRRTADGESYNSTHRRKAANFDRFVQPDFPLRQHDRKVSSGNKKLKYKRKTE